MIYAKFDGIDGEVTIEGFDKWIEFTSMQYGVGVGVESPSGGASGGKRTASQPSFSEVTMTKPLDQTSMQMMQYCAKGDSFKTIEIAFIKSAGNVNERYLTVKMSNTLISGHSMSSGGDRPSESISLNYTQIDFQYHSQKMDADKSGQAKFGWDLTKNIPAAS